MKFTLNRQTYIAIVLTIILIWLTFSGAINILWFGLIMGLIFLMLIWGSTAPVEKTLEEAELIALADAERLQKSNPPRISEGDIRLISEAGLSNLIYQGQMDPEKYNVIIEIEGKSIRYWLFVVSIWGNVTKRTELKTKKSVDAVDKEYRNLGARGSYRDTFKDRKDESRDRVEGGQYEHA